MGRLLEGRSGWDELTVMLAVLYLISCGAAAFWDLPFLALSSFLLLGLTAWRLFSRNLPARHAENKAFLRSFSVPRHKWYTMKLERHDKEHRYCICNYCGTLLRVPRGLGKIEITCPQCKEKNIRKV